MTSPRRPFIAGNWKMNTDAAECDALCRAVADSVASIAGVDVAVCPPFPYLYQAKQSLAGTNVRLGAQNVHWQETGAFTGEVGPLMLQGLVDDVIIGHSERRQYFGETDETVNQRLRAALAHELRPIVCVGETQQQREAGETNTVLARQLRDGIGGVDWNGDCVVAYEPIWAIGTGLAASATDANEATGYIRSLLAELFDDTVAGATRILYGGSVKAENAADYFSQPNIDGALVGGASLDAGAFAAIVRAAAESS